MRAPESGTTAAFHQWRRRQFLGNWGLTSGPLDLSCDAAHERGTRDNKHSYGFFEFSGRSASFEDFLVFGAHYGGGMSSAKAALESDTRVLAFEAGRKMNIRVNTISAGALKSRAAKAIGFVERMLEYSYANSPLQKELLADEVGYTAAFLVSPLASAITGSVLYVDNGLNTMGLATDSPTLSL
ncbi:hypothetical protein Taro_001928 [Colocasia esculenta]|uniref:Uncharacterized protein n=1 Tax=Colocasia esculenta TaxID=4460 RepID=A0A843TCM1_COLES|nr:hypothetical protein [Colocasia esculenta]